MSRAVSAISRPSIDVSLSIGAGEFFTLLGPSGCGKTTLLRMIAGFDLPDGGRILLNGEDLAERPPEARPVRTVFQSYALFPHMTVQGNVAFPLKMARTPAAEIPGKVAEALADVRLSGFGGRFPHELSGGQRQRVAIARALVTHPTILLLDEPLAALDAKLREEMQIELIDMQKEAGITFVYVTHDQTEALALSHRIAVMNKGHVEQIDAPDRLYELPSDALRGGIHRHVQSSRRPHHRHRRRRHHDCRSGPRSGDGGRRHGLAPGAEGAVALRPEKIRLHPPGNAPADANWFPGDRDRFSLSRGRDRVQGPFRAGTRARSPARELRVGTRQVLRVGDAVGMSWPADAGHFIEARPSDAAHADVGVHARRGIRRRRALLSGARSALMIDALRCIYRTKSARPPEAFRADFSGFKTRSVSDPSD